MSELNFTVGTMLPYHLLDAAQTHIQNEGIEAGMNVYRESLGLPDEFIFEILKGNAALVVNEDGTLVNYVDDPEVCAQFKDYLYDWNLICSNWAEDIRTRYIHLNRCLNEVGEAWNLKPDDKAYASINNVCALMILGNQNNQYSSPSSRWDRIEAEFESETAREKIKDVVNYKMIIDDYRYLKHTFEFYPVYKFLVDHELAKHVLFIEWYINIACSYITENLKRIKGFNTYSPDNSRTNPMLAEFFPAFYEEMMEAIRTYFPEYIKWGYMPCDIMDCYDAGFISPEGLFFGANGEYNELIHLEISKEITKCLCPNYDKDAQQYLTEQGWIAIHHNSVYCIFSGRLENYTADPTEAQIDVLCKYLKAFYGGQYSTKMHPDLSKEEDWISASKLKSADRFCRRDLLTSI